MTKILSNRHYIRRNEMTGVRVLDKDWDGIVCDINFVQQVAVPAGFVIPGGWGGAGSSEWKQDEFVCLTAGVIVIKPGTPEEAARWYYSPSE